MKKCLSLLLVLALLGALAVTAFAESAEPLTVADPDDAVAKFDMWSLSMRTTISTL